MTSLQQRFPEFFAQSGACVIDRIMADPRRSAAMIWWHRNQHETQAMRAHNTAVLSERRAGRDAAYLTAAQVEERPDVSAAIGVITAELHEKAALLRAALRAYAVAA